MNDLYIIATFFDYGEDSSSREITVVGEQAARGLFDKLVMRARTPSRTDNSYVGLWKAKLSVSGTVEYVENGELYNWVKNDFRREYDYWAKHGINTKKKPFFVALEEGNMAYENLE